MKKSKMAVAIGNSKEGGLLDLRDQYAWRMREREDADMISKFRVQETKV